MKTAHQPYGKRGERYIPTALRHETKEGAQKGFPAMKQRREDAKGAPGPSSPKSLYNARPVDVLGLSFCSSQARGIPKHLSDGTYTIPAMDLGQPWAPQKSDGKAQTQGQTVSPSELSCTKASEPKKGRGRPFPVKRKKRKDFWKVVRSLNGRQFRNMFRMTVRQFRTLTEILRPSLERNKMMAERSSGPIQVEVKVALLLRILAGASYQDLCLIFEIPTSSVYKLFHRFLDALLEVFTVPGLPTDEASLRKMAKKFKCSRRGGSPLNGYLREGKLVGPFWIAADEAYICTETLLTPFARSLLDRSVLSKYKDAYNFYHSSLRMHVEQAFGMLVARFGILWRPLRLKLQTNTKIVLAAMLLHNFCIEQSDQADTMPRSEKQDNERSFDLWYNLCRNELADQHKAVVSPEIDAMDSSMAKSKSRSDMVERLKYLRLPRPYAGHRFDCESEDDCP